MPNLTRSTSRLQLVLQTPDGSYVVDPEDGLVVRWERRVQEQGTLREHDSLPVDALCGAHQ